MYCYESKPARVRYRGWFVNDETLISHWKVERRSDLAFAMVFETLLRLGGNLVIPGTGENGHRYHDLAADMGLIITHHHAEPLGAKMFVQAYPELEPKFSLYPEKFRALWQDAIDRQKTTPTVWNIGFRGQGDKPFWEDDPQYDTPEKRGALISRLIREQYALVKQNDRRRYDRCGAGTVSGHLAAAGAAVCLLGAGRCSGVYCAGSRLCGRLAALLLSGRAGKKCLYCRKCRDAQP